MFEAQESLRALCRLDSAEFREQAAAVVGGRLTKLFSSSTSPVLAALANTGGVGAAAGPAADLLRFFGCAEAIFTVHLDSLLTSRRSRSHGRTQSAEVCRPCTQCIPTEPFWFPFAHAALHSTSIMLCISGGRFFFDHTGALPPWARAAVMHNSNDTGTIRTCFYAT